MPQNRNPRWHILLLAALSVALLTALWFAIRRLAGAVQVPPAVKIAGIAAASVSCLILALAWLFPILFRQNKKPPPGSFRILIGIYLLPLLVLALPLRLASLFLPSGSIIAGAQDWLRPGQPWLLAIQGCLLAAVLVPQVWKNLTLTFTPPPQWALAVLVGIGLWLICTFALSLFLRLSHQAWAPQPLPAPGLLVFVVIAALVILPLTEEYFFRKMLPESLLTIAPHSGWRHQPVLIWLGVAIIFAISQARPVLILPAFLLSLGLSALARHTGRLHESILVHMVFNLVALVSNWAAIL